MRLALAAATGVGPAAATGVGPAAALAVRYGAGFSAPTKMIERNTQTEAGEAGADRVGRCRQLVK